MRHQRTHGYQRTPRHQSGQVSQRIHEVRGTQNHPSAGMTGLPRVLLGLLLGLLFGLLFGGSLAGGGAVLAQMPATPPRLAPVAAPVQSALAIVPFGPGERATYQVKLGVLSVGEGSMEISGVEMIRGRPSYRVDWVIQGGIPFARVNDRFQSWFDVETLATRRFIQNIHEVRYRANRTYEIYPEEGEWHRLDTGERETFETDFPLDDISFIYYIRTLPLVVGETYVLDQYFREDRNPVTLQVLRRETIEVPAGTFRTIVVRPIIKAGGLFGEGGEAEVYFTDDDRRLLVRLSSRVPVVDSLSLHMRSYQPGTPLRR